MGPAGHGGGSGGGGEGGAGAHGRVTAPREQHRARGRRELHRPVGGRDVGGRVTPPPPPRHAGRSHTPLQTVQKVKTRTECAPRPRPPANPLLPPPLARRHRLGPGPDVSPTRGCLGPGFTRV